MTKQYIITEADIKCFKSWIRALGYGSISDARQAEQTMLGILQSLPELMDEPVAWLAQWHIEPTHYSEADGGLELVEPSAEGAFAVYTHAQPLQPITAKDVTDEMVSDHTKVYTEAPTGKMVLAAAVNAWIKHRGGK